MDADQGHAPGLLNLVPLEVDLCELRGLVLVADSLNLAGATGTQSPRSEQKMCDVRSRAASAVAAGACQCTDAVIVV